MAATPIHEGTLKFDVPGLPKSCFTYYKIVGDLKGRVPLITLHGGPGVGHEYLLPFAQLWEQYQIPVIFYDQIGCAQSSHLPQTAGDREFWQEDIFLAELENLIDGLHVRETGFHLLGHSFGGKLVAAYAARRPPGLRRLILASGLATTQLGVQGKQLLLKQLPQDVQDAFDKAERTGDYKDPEYLAATMVYLKTFLCRTQPFPAEELKAGLRHQAEDNTVVRTIYGPSLVTVNDGSMKDWTVIPRLKDIVATTLVYKGEYDYIHDIATEPFFELIPRVRWITISHGSHMCHIEAPTRDQVMKLVGNFVTQPEDA